ncbi:MAG: glycerate kinase [Acidimicrobiaceae bacterium]|nr:glycerate kinase [Acidimicrobiaceae bacterium]
MLSLELVAAPDKFRGTASAPEVAAAVLAGAERAGWSGVAVPLADGGEGLLEALGGEPRHTTVTGPLGDPVEAEWRLLSPEENDGPVAVVEMARASGLVLAGGASENDPEAATTRGTGELIAAALHAGAHRVIVGCGGSATTDGGEGALEVLSGIDLSGIDLLIACDVTTPFLDAAKVFGPQKGAGEAQVERLGRRLGRVAERYANELGVDVRSLSGAGAAGGLAGGLAALGGRIVSGFGLVADMAGLEARLAAGPDLVVTGEGRFDETSLAGKVVGGVVEAVAGRAPVLVVSGAASVGVAVPRGVEVISLADRYGLDRALSDPVALVAEVVEDALGRLARR